MSPSVCDLRVSSRPLVPQESTYFSSAGYTRKRIFKKVYAKTFAFTFIKAPLSQPRPHSIFIPNCFRGRLMSPLVCDLRVSSRPLVPQESTYFSSAGYTRKRIFKKVYAKTFAFTF